MCVCSVLKTSSFFFHRVVWGNLFHGRLNRTKAAGIALLNLEIRLSFGKLKAKTKFYKKLIEKSNLSKLKSLVKKTALSLKKATKKIKTATS